MEPVAQLLGVAAARLNITVLLPWLVPKLVPLMVIGVPVVPLWGLTSVMDGTTVVNGKLLLAKPFCLTKTTPEFEPSGTVATISVGVQLAITVALRFPNSK
jgi:hypothetical protein